MNNRAHIRLAAGLLLVLALLGAVMSRQIPPRIDLPFETTSTTLAAEFATAPEDINTLVGSDRRYAKAIEQQQYVDFLFIGCYVALMVVIGLALREYELPGARWLAWAAIVGAVLAGLCDIGENIAILKTVRTPGSYTSIVRWFSVPKWSLVFLVMTIESAVFLFWPRLTLWWRLAALVVGGLFLFTGVSGLLFSALVSVPDIAWSAEWMTWAMAALTLFFVALAVSTTKHLRY